MKVIRLKSFKSFVLGGLLACGLLPALASATPVNFNINGHYNFGVLTSQQGDFNGTMSIDTATGDLLSFEVLFADIPVFNESGLWLSYGSKRPPQWTIQAVNAWGGLLALTFTTPQVDGYRKKGSLVGFEGGSIVGDQVFGSFLSLPYAGCFSGDITPAQVSVPEPAALGLFGAGVLLLGMFVGLRRRID